METTRFLILKFSYWLRAQENCSKRPTMSHQPLYVTSPHGRWYPPGVHYYSCSYSRYDAGSTSSTGMNSGVPVAETARQRMKPWLEHHINSGNIPGLQWLDKQQKIFKVPWKHVGNREWSESDGTIFKEWAKHTGRYREGHDPMDWPTWKTRFRCALTKLPDIKELRNLNRLDGQTDEPYRVYQFVPRNNVENSPPVASQSLMVEHYDENSMQCETLFSTSGNALPTTIQSDSMNSNPRIDSDLGRIDTADLIKVSGEGFDLKNISMDTEFEEMRLEEQDRKDFPRINVPMFYRWDESDCKLYVTVNYQRQRMIEELCSEPNGCRIFYDKCVPITDVNEYREFFGHEKAKVIQLPDPSGIQTLNSQQHKLTQDLLQATDRGLTLQMKNGSIFATRKCRCRIYVSTPSWSNGDLLKLERDVETNIFDVDSYFKPALNKYMHQKGPRPLAEVIISFGQQFSSRESFNDLLISATVVHAEAQNFLTSIMCTSPITPNIEISRSDNIDKTMDFRYQLIQYNN
ncbi:hypothetical protein DPMN_170887 [Dreissena polymorpha]|uniref:IRF tryptophan pentad repeat domain-containing protein n=2 Tax=Dreissena polymorpha TaxID=45954 RepID=A0A9D4DX37_DREPO|nr:hypothetical protein DPMN_170887 [Dreissena polymorpha]